MAKYDADKIGTFRGASPAGYQQNYPNLLAPSQFTPSNMGGTGGIPGYWGNLVRGTGNEQIPPSRGFGGLGQGSGMMQGGAQNPASMPDFSAMAMARFGMGQGGGGGMNIMPVAPNMPDLSGGMTTQPVPVDKMQSNANNGITMPNFNFGRDLQRPQINGNPALPMGTSGLQPSGDPGGMIPKKQLFGGGPLAQ